MVRYRLVVDAGGLIVPVMSRTNHRVEVVRLGAYCDPAVNYQLKVSLE